MEKAKKRARNVNFTHEETEQLLSFIQTKISIIENKKSDAVTWQEKENAWKAIQVEFNNSTRGVFRDSKHLRLKYEALKRDTRKKTRIVQAELYKNGGENNNAPALTAVEEKVKQMILLPSEGDENTDLHQVKSGELLL